MASSFTTPPLISAENPTTQGVPQLNVEPPSNQPNCVVYPGASIASLPSTYLGKTLDETSASFYFAPGAIPAQDNYFQANLDDTSDRVDDATKAAREQNAKQAIAVFSHDFISTFGRSLVPLRSVQFFCYGDPLPGAAEPDKPRVAWASKLLDFSKPETRRNFYKLLKKFLMANQVDAVVEGVEGYDPEEGDQAAARIYFGLVVVLRLGDDAASSLLSASRSINTNARATNWSMAIYNLFYDSTSDETLWATYATEKRLINLYNFLHAGVVGQHDAPGPSRRRSNSSRRRRPRNNIAGSAAPNPIDAILQRFREAAGPLSLRRILFNARQQEAYDAIVERRNLLLLVKAPLSLWRNFYGQTADEALVHFNDKKATSRLERRDILHWPFWQFIFNHIPTTTMRLDNISHTILTQRLVYILAVKAEGLLQRPDVLKHMLHILYMWKKGAPITLLTTNMEMLLHIIMK